jgi:holo-[acyl-carrier protein] synthase
MVIGVGTDITEIGRIEHSIARFGDRFLERIFSPGEIAYCRLRQRKSAQSFAARFAAKEAGAKALGTGISRGIGWQDLEVVRPLGERPTLRLHGRAAERARALGVNHINLSITHTTDTALAIVIMES